MPTTISSTDDQLHAAPTTDTMPHDADAEQAVIGGMLQSASATAAAIEAVQPGDFYIPHNGAIFQALAEMYTAGKRSADILLASDELASRGLLTRTPGGPLYLHTCMAAVPTVANTGYYAGIVRDHADSRRLIVAGMQIAAVGRKPGGDKASMAAEILSRACLPRASDGPVQIGVGMQDTLSELDTGMMVGPSTGFKDLDRLIHGLRPGLITVAGRPGAGKSTAAVDMARSLALRQGLSVLMFSLEMGRGQIRKRIISAEARVPHHRLMTGGTSLTDDDWQRITDVIPRIDEAPLDIDETAGLTIHEISARTRIRAARGGLACVIVDHIGLCGPVLGGRASRTEEIGAITRGLLSLHKSLNIPVIMVSQLNRASEQRTDKRPQLSDLRESGNIEQDSTIVILVHRDDYYDKECPRAGEADFIVAKNRDGEQDTIVVASQLHYARFADMAVV